MNITIFEVANWFLSRQSMTHKKLQKLCYYAQAWHLALFQNELFTENFEAWVHGPVNKDLYQKYKENGWNLIPQAGNINIALEISGFLERIWETYGEYDGHQLEALTRSEAPWINARVGLNTWQASNVSISGDDMANYYRGQYDGD